MAIQNDKNITKEQTNTVDFLLLFENVCKCIIRTSNNDKIIFFKNLIKSNLTEFNTNDESDEFTDSLDRLSLKDIEVLVKLYQYVNENKLCLNASLSEYNICWDDLVISFNDGRDAFLSHCRRLSGFGFCREYIGYTDYVGGTFILTEYGNKFIQSIFMNNI